VSLCLNTGKEEAKARKSLGKIIVEAKGFFTLTTTKEGKR